jgi:hypothetical protein
MSRTLKHHQKTFDLLGRAPEISPSAAATLAQREQELGLAFPPSLKEWYSLEGAERILYQHSNQDPPIPLAELGHPEHLAQGVLCIQNENQGVAAWFVRLDGSDDPPVDVASEMLDVLGADPGGERIDNWLTAREAATFSEYVHRRVLAFGGAANVRAIGEALRQRDARVIFDGDGQIESISFGATIGDAELDRLAGLSIQEISPPSFGLKPSGWDRLRRLKELKRLRLWGDKIDDADAEEICGIRGLTDLQMLDTAVTDAGWRHLCEKLSLEGLMLRSDRITDEGFVAIANQTSLKRLYLQNMPLPSRRLEAVSALPQLEKLHLADVWLDDANLKPLVQNSSLKSLVLDRVSIRDELVAELRRACPSLEAYRDLSAYRIQLVLEDDGWHVDYELKDPNLKGGGPHYLIDARTGAILSKRYEQ